MQKNMYAWECHKICGTHKHLDKYTKYARKKLRITCKDETLSYTTMNVSSSESIHFSFCLLILFLVITIIVWKCCCKLLQANLSFSGYRY